MVWPGAIERAITVIEEAPFLSTAEKRAIFYDNAARFLRLSEEEMARHRQCDSPTGDLRPGYRRPCRSSTD